MKLLLYCTKSKPYLFPMKENKPFELNSKCSKYGSLNGKIVGECDFEIDRAYPFHHWCKELQEGTCLTRDEVLNYLDSKNKEFSNPKIQRGVYAIHIKNLHIFDKPKELSDFCKTKDYEFWQTIKKAPQNMMYAYYINIKQNIFIPYVLASIKPQWLCKILNGEKTIEVRKVVPNGMFTKGLSFHWKKEVIL